MTTLSHAAGLALWLEVALGFLLAAALMVASELLARRSEPRARRPQGAASSVQPWLGAGI